MTDFTLNDLKRFIEGVTEEDLGKKVEVLVVSQGSAGPTPTVKVSDVAFGFDWDTGKLLIHTQEPVIKLTPEELKSVRESVSKAHSYHTGIIVKPLMTENRKLRELLLSIDPSLLNDEQLEVLKTLNLTNKKG
jgi:hypothetical protein